MLRALTETEQRFSNIKRELLAIVFAPERLNHYTFGRTITIQSDHQPLQSIWEKSTVSASPRLQRLLLKLATQSDTTLQNLSMTIHEGWPQSRKDCPKQLLEFWNFKQISKENGILYKNHRLIVPNSERPETLKVLHLGHYTVDKMQLRALKTVYWPGINKDILKQYQSCKTCTKHSKSQRHKPPQSHPSPELPWHTMATDLFELKNSKYLLLVDYYSRFPVLHKLHSTSSRVSIQEMKAVFTELGIPNVIVSDGGPQYVSVKFKDFMQQWQIEHSLITKKPLIKLHGREVCADYESITNEDHGRRGRCKLSTPDIQDDTPKP